MIYFAGGFNNQGKMLAVAIGSSDDPERAVERLRETAPFKTRLLAVEDGSGEALERLRNRFRTARLQGPWFKGTEALTAYLDALPPLSVSGKTTRISLDVTAREFQQIESARLMLGVKTKAKFIRRAIRFFVRVVTLQSQGFLIQAIKDGTLYQFQDLDHDPTRPDAHPK